ncbi:MAG: hypothetical protein ABIH23_25635 [bacterium]
MIAILTGFWQCYLVIALGSLFVWRHRTKYRLGEVVALSTGVGLALTSALIFLLLLAGLIRSIIVLPLFVALTVVSARQGYTLLKCSVRAVSEAIRANPALAVLSALLLLPQFLSGLTPEVEVDSLWYHLGVPQFYLMRGGLCEVPFTLPSHYPMNFHMQYVFSLLIGNDQTAKVVIVFLFFPICSLIYSMTKHRSNRSAAFLAVVVYLAMIHHRIPVMSNVQRAVLLFTLLSTMFLWRWMEEKNDLFFWMSAFWCGVAMGTKFNALIFCLLLHSGAAFLWMVLNRDWSRLLPRLIGYQAVGWILLSPWMAKSYLYTGNPLYPLLGGLFGAREEYVEAMHSNDWNHGLNLTRSNNIHEFIQEIFRNIRWMLFNTDVIFLIIPFALLLLFIQRRRYIPQLLTGAVALVLFTFLWGSDVGRLFALTYGFFSVVIGIGLSLLVKNSRAGRFAFWAVAVVLPATLLIQKASYCSLPQIDWHGSIHISDQSRLDYLLTHGILSHEDLEIADFIEQNLSEDYSLYLYHCGYPFYLDFPKVLPDLHFGDVLDQWLCDKGPEETAERLRRLHVRYLLKGPRVGWKPLTIKGGKERFDAFIQVYARSLKKSDIQEIFEFDWTAEPR